jgi:hypothetical protein
MGNAALLKNRLKPKTCLRVKRKRSSGVAVEFPPFGA